MLQLPLTAYTRYNVKRLNGFGGQTTQLVSTAHPKIGHGKPHLLIIVNYLQVPVVRFLG